MPHVASRIQKFLNPASGDTFNIDIATESFMRGGWFGRGPGEGTVKRLLPESHTDFVFAVAAEEFGVALCLALVALFAFIVIRALARAMRNDDAFTRFAAAGLAILFGMQSAINVAVNLHLIPAKGMTLPFISYGGSSMLSLAYAMGMLLALTREQPRAAMLTAPELAVAEHGERELDGAHCDAAPLRRLLAAGGTGGHLFPGARRWPTRLQKRGAVVDLATDDARRPFQVSRRAPCIVIPSATLRGRNPIALARTAALLTLGTAKAWSMLGARAPRRGGRLRRLSDRAAAAGGERCAASRPCCTSRTASWAAPTGCSPPRVTAIATGFRTLARPRSASARQDHLHRQSGAPRSDCRGGDALCRAGAERKTAPAGVRRQPGRARDGRDRAGGDRAPRRRSARALGGRAAGARRGPRRGARDLCPAWRCRRDCAPFFSDLPARMAAAHLVISRSGASTVAELSAIGRPAILVPLPHALDQDQFANAGVLEAAGGAIRIEQRDFTPDAPGRRDRALWPATRAGLPAWRRPPNRPAPSTPPSGWPTWC